MIFYEFQLHYTLRKKKKGELSRGLMLSPETEGFEREFSKRIEILNKGMRNLSGSAGKVTAQICRAVPEDLSLVMGCEASGVPAKEDAGSVCAYLKEHGGVQTCSISGLTEIDGKTYSELIERGIEDDLICRWRQSDVKPDYFENAEYKLTEILSEEREWTVEEACERARRILGDESLFEEIERIYSPENEKGFFGIPVHYRICATETGAAKSIIEVLVGALLSNGRLCGSRVSYLSDISESCFRERDVDRLFRYSEGTAVALETAGDNEDHGNYASSYRQVTEYFDELIRKHRMKTLFILVDLSGKEGFGRAMAGRIAESTDLVEIREGCGERDKALAYFLAKAEKEGLKADPEEAAKLFEGKKLYSAGEVNEIYASWARRGLRERIYRAYRDCATVRVENRVTESEPYRELQEMVGLSGIKEVIDELLDAAKIRKLRSKAGLDNVKTSLHMIFTGNPGSAKTSVARLVSAILKKEGILESGHLVECGRSDLVGKYVGWTARQVSKYFRMAKGGVLFIDEAYSLVDDSNSFGDEAINTIVQEMENRREDTVVIFAGYPDRMKEFLAKNEGLRSRIAFYLDFPDYDGEELFGILRLMTEKRGLKLGDGVEERCMEIFGEACKIPEFGNGRFVRNLLDRAQMAQSRRILRENKGRSVGKNVLKTLLPEDFRWESPERKDTQHRIGFGI